MVQQSIVITYEMAVLTELREHVRAGDVSIVGSRL